MRNPKHVLMRRDAPLLNEFERIFSDIFGMRSNIYKKIIHRLVVGAASQEEILVSCGRNKTGDFSEYLTDFECPLNRVFLAQVDLLSSSNARGALKHLID